MHTCLAIDPGPERSAWVYIRDGAPDGYGLEDNHRVIHECEYARSRTEAVAIEMIASYGMAVGQEVFQTCFWIGRFYETLTRCSMPVSDISLVKRQEVKLAMCHSAKANDSTIRQAIIDRFGGKEKAIGKKATPGPLYYIKADIWQALALGLTWWDQHKPAGYRSA